MVSGTPSAERVEEPKLARMSDRTMPLWVSAFGPLEPSPGYGPAVSSGMVFSASEAVAPEEDDVVVGSAEVVIDGAQATRVRPAAPPSSDNACLRPTRVARSNWRPRSWLSVMGTRLRRHPVSRLCGGCQR